jgi:hypothetical protein
VLAQTGWLLPITGIPCDVPVPKKYTRNLLFFYKNKPIIFCRRAIFITL